MSDDIGCATGMAVNSSQKFIYMIRP